MTKLSINFWDEEIEFQMFSIDMQPDYRKYLDENWKKVVQENDMEKAFNFAWSLRSILWPELVKKGALEIRFAHDGSSGTGFGPLMYFGNTQGIKDLPTKSIQDRKNGLILESLFFSASDIFMANYFEGVGFLGIPSLQIEFLAYEVIEINEEEESLETFFENTFSADFKISDMQLHETSWADLAKSEQNQILHCLTEFSLGQLEVHGEYVHEVTDLFASILAHDLTDLDVRQKLLRNLDSLQLSDLVSIR